MLEWKGSGRLTARSSNSVQASNGTATQCQGVLGLLHRYVCIPCQRFAQALLTADTHVQHQWDFHVSCPAGVTSCITQSLRGCLCHAVGPVPCISPVEMMELYWICATLTFFLFVHRPRSCRTCSDTWMVLDLQVSWAGGVLVQGAHGCERGRSRGWAQLSPTPPPVPGSLGSMEVLLLAARSPNKNLAVADSTSLALAWFKSLEVPICVSRHLRTSARLLVGLSEPGTDVAHQPSDKTDVSRSEQFLKWNQNFSEL